MKNSPTALSLAFDARRANLPQAIALVSAFSLAVGFIFSDTVDELIAYLLLTGVCVVPIAIWIQSGANSIPVMATVASLSFLYYAVPILRKNTDLAEFAPWEFLSAAGTVVLYMGTATFSWWLLVAAWPRRKRKNSPQVLSGIIIERIMFIGLAIGLIYQVAIYMGGGSWLGSALGPVRSAMLTTATVACFMLGHVQALDALKRGKLIFAIAGLCLMVTLSWASLFLVTGITFCLATIFGYVITSRRIPLVFLSVAVSILFVLHAGKEGMRHKYWFAHATHGAEFSITEVPERIVEWIESGLVEIQSGDSYASVIDRASLLALLMRVQRLTPDYIQPLEGKTYALIPQMVIPRFIAPEKIASQASVSMLNVQFGFQTEEGTQSTTIGWGLIAEAYANFGRAGVVGVAFVVGFLCGLLERWSAGNPLISLPSLIAIVAMMQLINVEADAAGLVTTLLQSLIGISAFFWCFGILSKRRKPALAANARV